MTVNQKLTQMMIERGLWKHEAKDVINSIKNDPSMDTISSILERDWTGYPPQLHSVVWLSTQKIVLAYIDKNCPEHWARPMFLMEEK